MATRWDTLADRRIRAAQAQGTLDRLQGQGKPLPDRPEAAFVDPGEAVGYRIMAEHGALPQELRLKAEVEAARAALQAETDPDARRAAMKRFAEAQLRHDIAREARRRFMGG